MFRILNNYFYCWLCFCEIFFIMYIVENIRKVLGVGVIKLLIYIIIKLFLISNGCIKKGVVIKF